MTIQQKMLQTFGMKNTIFSKSQKTIILATILSIACIVYALISLVNHYLFKTYALDLGFYTHAMYDYAHFRADDCSMILTKPQSILSAHFDLYLVILSPLVYLFGTYTLLIVQIAAVLFGGLGIYKLIGLYSDDNLIPLGAMVAFLFSFGIIHALSYDYHSNVVSTMMLPWMLYFLKKGRYRLSTLFVVLIVMGKENMSLWLFFIAIGLMWDYRKDKKTLWYLFGYTVFAVVYFVVVNMIILPKLGANGIIRYAYLGDNYWEIAKNLITEPRKTLQILFTNTSDWPRFDGVKTEFYLCALASGMLLTFLKPNYLIMLIPLLAQKMLSIDPNFWGIALQYNIEFVPILVISSFLVALRLKQTNWKRIVSIAVVLSVIITTFYTIGVPKTKIQTDKLCMYQGRHYEQKDFDANFARKLIQEIPKEASVCAAPMFVPHLCLRSEIYDFAYTNNHQKATYLLINRYYFNHEKNNESLLNEYEVIETDGTVILLKKKHG